MAAPHQYHQPNAPDDGDSDLELDLEELDPLAGRASASPARNVSSAPRKPYRELGARIPLRNLRVGRLRGNKRTQEPEEEDLQGLIEDENRHSDGSYGQSGDEDSALLSSRNNDRPKHQRKPSALSRFQSTMRLPSFLSAASPNRQAIQLGQVAPAHDDAEEEHDPTTQRIVAVGQSQTARFPANAVSNAKYTPWSFLPRTLYNEFSFFINMYFLLVALSQVIPALKIGYVSTYVVPLGFVISVTLGKEALDDIARRRRDAEANAEPYTVLKFEESGGNGVAPGRDSSRRRRLRRGRGPSGGRTTDIEDEEQQTATIGGLPTAR
jgi:phospholipid-translocating ATPase